ncbi:MAG: DUF5671 domain-containing protein [Chloroflexota bacterium]
MPDSLFLILATLLGAFFWIAIVGGIVAVVRRGGSLDDEPSGDPGIGTVRRVFIYGLALIGVIFAATGVSMIISGALDAMLGNILIQDRRQALATALAFTIVGTPAWLLFMLLAQRSIQAHAVERRSQARRLYFALLRSIGLAIVASNAITVARMIIDVEDFSGGAWGSLVAWGGVWFIHHRLALAEPPETATTRLIDRLALYFGALFGLALMLTGAEGLISLPLSEAYDRVFRSTVLSGSWTITVRESGVLLVVGAVIWALYWVRELRQRDRLTMLWRTYVFLFGALPGVAIAIVPTAVMLYTVIEWYVGVPVVRSAAEQFSAFPDLVSALIIGIATWGYHGAVIAESGNAAERSGPERVYRYVLSAAGLVTTTVGVASLIALAAEGMAGASGQSLLSGDWWRNSLLSGMTEILVGVPLWAWYWGDAQQTLATGVEERASTARRVYVFAVVGVAVFTLLVSLMIVLYQLFEAVLAGTLSLTLLRDGNWAIATALTTGAVAYYHILVLREDQAAMPDAESTPTIHARRVVLLASSDASTLIAELERVEGVRVQSWRRLDGDASAATATGDASERHATLLAAVTSTDAERMLVIVRDDGFEVLPYVDGQR